MNTFFDAATGNFRWNADTSVYTTYPPGDYLFRITAIGSEETRTGGAEVTASVDFILNLPDLCLTSTVAIKDGYFS